ncbi:rRNA N6-adenosine-methyltransferase ZCCHC4 isoform X2 [Toxorhynchites rutilus septentrionalis]|nr:rRNA N6-adenosine-methyltransferase ZCCHC4 isoform X2 [Toxorhynchites rutilus septentrionalis]
MRNEVKTSIATEMFTEVRNAEASQKMYCITCQKLLLKSDLSYHKNHRVYDELDEETLKEPTRVLLPLSRDGNEAQYFFTDSALHCFESIFRHLMITKVLCVGAPRLHEYLSTKTNISSLLLDIDERFRWFYDEDHFVHYNMFNHYFFNGQCAENVFGNFLLNPGFSHRICIFTDPPFGCRTELLANAIRTINQSYNRINSTTQEILPVFLIFPYFMENYVQKVMSAMEMTDYQVNYSNHDKFHDGKSGLKNGTPVRMFTNVPMDSFSLPADQGYKYCSKCRRYTHISNSHCSICKMCPSKNGSTYRHCLKCNWCVKPNYKHCNRCGRCTQIQGHVCHSYVNQITCRICTTKGHTEKNCVYWKIKHKKFNTGCLICGGKSHIIKHCKLRKQRLKEKYFLGNYSNSINNIVE